MVCLPACLLACSPQRAPWTKPPTVTRQKRSTAAEVPNTGEPLGAKNNFENNKQYQGLREQEKVPRTPRTTRSAANSEKDKKYATTASATTAPMTRPTTLAAGQPNRLVPTVGGNHTLVAGLKEGREFHHSRCEDGVTAPQRVAIRDEVPIYRASEGQLQAIGYEYQWQRQRCRIRGICVQLFVVQVARKRPRQELRTVGATRKRAKVGPSSRVQGMGKRRKDTLIRVSSRFKSLLQWRSARIHFYTQTHDCTHPAGQHRVIRGTLARTFRTATCYFVFEQ